MKELRRRWSIGSHWGIEQSFQDAASVILSFLMDVIGYGGPVDMC